MLHLGICSSTRLLSELVTILHWLDLVITRRPAPSIDTSLHRAARADRIARRLITYTSLTTNWSQASGI